MDKLGNQEERDKLLETYNLQCLNHDEIENLKWKSQMKQTNC